jgi:putative RNA 2'-phosphotransferase
VTDARRISKTLSYWLRHRPDDGGLALDASGWAPVDDVLAALGRAGIGGGRDALALVVAESGKERFEFSGDGHSIRARQGQSLDVDLDWPEAAPPEFLFHGTVERFLASILADGLKPMKRHHVHLSPDEATARAVGARRGEPVILKISAGLMAADGHVFRLSGNGVWLADHVAPAYLERLTATPGA